MNASVRLPQASQRSKHRCTPYSSPGHLHRLSKLLSREGSDLVTSTSPRSAREFSFPSEQDNTSIIEHDSRHLMHEELDLSHKARNAQEDRISANNQYRIMQDQLISLEWPGDKMQSGYDESKKQGRLQQQKERTFVDLQDGFQSVKASNAERTGLKFSKPSIREAINRHMSIFISLARLHIPKERLHLFQQGLVELSWQSNERDTKAMERDGYALLLGLVDDDARLFLEPRNAKVMGVDSPLSTPDPFNS